MVGLRSPEVPGWLFWPVFKIGLEDRELVGKAASSSYLQRRDQFSSWPGQCH